MPPSGTLAAAIQIAERSGRTDLATRLRANRDQIRRTGVTVAVVGEFKKGKSSLVNALVNAEVCPSDPVDATVAPIVVHHGEELAVTVERKGEEPAAVDLMQVAVLGSEAGNDANRLGVTRIDITVPRRLLASGLVLIDTPGVGGLESAAGALNLATLDQADGVLFVTDCSQELTAPEIAYLKAARQRCPTVVCVMTKRDLYLAADVLADHNRRHLAAAGLEDVQVLMVSSVLHLLALAQGDGGLEQESGFGQLFDAIHTTIWEPARRRGLAEAGEQLADLADHLAMPLDAARKAEGSEEAARQTIARLSEAQDRVKQFRSELLAVAAAAGRRPPGRGDRPRPRPADPAAHAGADGRGTDRRGRTGRRPRLRGVGAQDRHRGRRRPLRVDRRPGQRARPTRSISTSSRSTGSPRSTSRRPCRPSCWPTSTSTGSSGC